MDPELEKKIKRAEPTKAESKRLYDQPLRVLRRGPDRKMKGFPKRRYRSEAEEIFFSISWDEAWQQFLERNSDGRFKYKTAFELSSALAVGINAQVRKHRAGDIYSAIGPVSASDKTKQVPYLGDWDMLRSQTFLGEMRRDSVLFSSPTMKTMRAALREHIDVTHTAKDMAEVLLGWLARCEAWARQIDEYFGYTAFDKKLSLAKNKQRFAEYFRLQESLRTASASIIEQILACYGVGKDGMAVLAQLIVASRLQGPAGDRAHEMILAGLSGVDTLDGKATGGGVDAAPDLAQQDVESNRALQLMVASFADKAITYRMPHPQLNIPGVPDEDDQETPLQHIKRQVRGMMLDGESKKIQ
jgi:hypothetical protein